jgi:flagellar motor switch protein FliG
MSEFNDETDQAELPVPVREMDGASAAAILLMLLDESEAASILKHFEPDEVRTLGTAMFAASAATETEIEIALNRFVGGSRLISTFAVGAEPRIRNVMNEALGNIRADNILASIAPQSSAVALDILRWMDVPTITALLSEEHPQVGAIILSVLLPEIAAEVLEALDDATQSDLVFRAARLSSISIDAIADLEAILAGASIVQGAKPKMKLGGKADVAKIVNRMKKPSSERVLRSLKKKDRQLGQDIEEEMFIFDNLIDLDAKNLGEVMRSVDSSSLGLALKGANPVLVDKILGAMSARAAQSIRDDMAELGPVKRADVEEAQRAIIAIARKLAEDGTILLGGKGDDYV